MASLDDAYARLDRAREHLEDLKKVRSEICEARTKATVVTAQPKVEIDPSKPGTITLFEANASQVPIPSRCRVLAGDVATNLRSALNYLVQQLAVLDTGTASLPKGRRQFPIEDTPEKFQQNSATMLKGLSSGHVTAIENLQPYRGCEWTKHLRRLSNADKHEELIFLDTWTSMGMQLTSRPKDPANPGAGSEMHLNVELRPFIRIGLFDGKVPLVETLEIILSQVAQMLDAFKPEFE